MSFSVRDGYFDLVILSGPRLDRWPSVGVQILSRICSEMGLKVGVFGGPTVSVKGVVPLPPTSGLVLIEDLQKRIHRIHARAIVKVVRSASFPMPFEGWRGDGLIPYTTAHRLLAMDKMNWGDLVAILGSGNRAFRIGSEFLEKSLAKRVVSIETFAQWGGKRFSGWEVEKRRFEMLGGRCIEAQPVSLEKKGAQAYEFRIRDDSGVQILKVSRVISAGPFYEGTGVREYPPQSNLYEFEQTAPVIKEESVEDWVSEKARAESLATKITRALVTDLGDQKEVIAKKGRRSRLALQANLEHQAQPFTPSFRGKWLEEEDLAQIQAFEGTPKKLHQKKLIASLECMESIACDLCERACPVEAIRIDRKQNQFLFEDQCIGCGACVVACPSRAVTMLEEKEKEAQSDLVLPWFRGTPPKKGERVMLLNRQGEALESGRVIDYFVQKDPFENTRKVKEKPRELAPEEVTMIQVKVPTHLIWEARGFKKIKSATEDEESLAFFDENALAEKVEVSLDGERRWVRDGVSITEALFETGYSRPGDILNCEDGSCGLCTVLVDGVRKSACQETIHRGMAIRLDPLELQNPSHLKTICPCLDQKADVILEKIQKSGVRSLEALISRTRLGEGRCHGQICVEALRSFLAAQGIEGVDTFIDWRFPWSDWPIVPQS